MNNGVMTDIKTFGQSKYDEMETPGSAHLVCNMDDCGFSGYIDIEVSPDGGASGECPDCMETFFVTVRGSSRAHSFDNDE